MNAIGQMISLLSLLAIPSVTLSYRDRLSLHSGRWSSAVIVFGVIVAVGCCGELFETRDAWRRWRKAKKGLISEPVDETSWHIPVAAVGLMLVIVGVAGETISESFVSVDETSIRAYDENALATATTNAGDAKNSAGLAASAASSAEAASAGAVAKASKANDSATHALTEADAFERGIVSANQKAENAERDLANAIRQVAAAQAELNALKSPRKFLDSENLLEKLKAFSGTKYGFSGVYQDEESIDLLKTLDSLLQQAGWIRQQLPDPFPAIRPYGKSDTLSVSVALMSGVVIASDSEQTVESLRSLPFALLPKHLQAAEVLYRGLSTNLAPPQNLGGDKARVIVYKGATGVIAISVGKKP